MMASVGNKSKRIRNGSRLLWITFLLCWTVSGYAQYEKDYKPFKYSSSGGRMSEATFHKKVNIPYNTSDQALIRKFNHYLYTLYRTYTQASKEKQFIEEPYVKKYLRTILDTICAANHIKTKFEIVCTRYAEPNAFNMGDNRFYVNIGLLAHLTTEAQIAFMLSHEMAHQLLFHVQDHFIASENWSKSKQVKKEIHDINRARYNKLDRTFQLFKQTGYKFARYSRANEYSADSMAVVMVGKTGYDVREGKTLFRILEKTEKDSSVLDYKTWLGDKDHPLQDAWLTKKENLLSFGKQKVMELDEDSVQSHPDIPVRIKAIDSQLLVLHPDLRQAKTFLQSETLFDSLAQAAKFELVEAYLTRNRYAAVMYYGLLLLKEYPDNAALYKNTCTAMHELNKAIKKHTVQNYIPIESEDYSEAYNSFLRLIDRTSADEFDALCKAFIIRYHTRFSVYPESQTLYDEYTKK